MTEFYDRSVIEQTPHHNAMGELVDLLCHRTGNVNRDFFQAEVAYFLALIPTSMRATIASPERGNLPMNIYSVGLATSGFGKGHSVSVMEDVIAGFRDDFMQSTMPQIAETALFDLAVDIAAAKGGDEQQEHELIKTDYKRQGHAPFIFDSGTGPAVKQLRYKLLLAKCGSINFQMDEIGSNLVGNTEVLNTLLELYDLGKIKAKLVKNTSDNERGLDIVGSTPANVLMFGTSSKLFDGSKTEEEFYSFLATGYARRCFFGIGKSETTFASIQPEAVYNGLVSKNQSQALARWKQYLTKFADPRFYDQQIDVPKDVGVELVSYRLQCEAEANELPEHEEIRKAELSHRYFKSLKLAGVYAFLDESSEITQQHLRQAIKVAEESGASFQKLLKRERNFVRLAKYIATSPDNLTHADLVEDLPYYPTSTTARREMMDLAMAWGVSNHVVITKNVVQSVEFFSGDTLQETDLEKLSFSFSDHFAYDYDHYEQPFDKLPKLLEQPGMHWANHAFEENHRHEDKVLPGFNLIVIDVDGHTRDKEGNITNYGPTLDQVHELLGDYTFITQTTKSHTDEEHRFRLILPTNYVLKLDKDDYKEFMDSFAMWLPFVTDTAANQRSRKWRTNDLAQIHVNKGPQVIDVLPFIPKTKANNEYVQQVADLGNLDNLERWFLNNMDVGNRNNNLLNYAMMLKDAGASFDDVEKKVLDLNKRSNAPLKVDELQMTVLKSVASKYS
ncbi:DNA primase [Roseobacter phage RD-1410W1-01]|uniref:DNA primase n=1 Tax=Roseobacter phage RD-1410W1-01 TaxID=1815984 RepID=A0A191VYK6_9CAUD|nr:DNA primase [Roseobacter phage RD-1410W1-01]ANJ20793.1 DNA primase [Roseobacter phage RD-1410W1-01]